MVTATKQIENAVWEVSLNATKTVHREPCRSKKRRERRTCWKARTGGGLRGRTFRREGNEFIQETGAEHPQRDLRYSEEDIPDRHLGLSTVRGQSAIYRRIKGWRDGFHWRVPLGDYRDQHKVSRLHSAGVACELAIDAGAVRAQGPTCIQARARTEGYHPRIRFNFAKRTQEREHVRVHTSQRNAMYATGNQTLFARMTGRPQQETQSRMWNWSVLDRNILRLGCQGS